MGGDTARSRWFDATTMSFARLHIGHVIQPNSIGGCERHLTELCRLQARQAKVTVFVGPGRDGGEAAARLCMGLETHANLHHFDGSAQGLADCVARSAPDLLHAHLEPAERLVMSQARRPRIVTLHGTYYAHRHAAFDGIVRVANWQAGAMAPEVAARATTICNWVTPELDFQTREAARRALGLDPDVTAVCAVGRFSHEKGFDTLIEAAALPDLRAVMIVIFGTGAEETALRAIAPSNVKFAGFRDDVRRYLKAFDGAVVPSRREAFGLQLLEFMDAGLPVASTLAPGPLEILGRSHAFLAPIDDAPALGRAIVGMLADVRRPVYDLSRFDPERQVAATLAFYQAILDGAYRASPATMPF